MSDWSGPRSFNQAAMDVDGDEGKEVRKRDTSQIKKRIYAETVPFFCADGPAG